MCLYTATPSYIRAAVSAADIQHDLVTKSAKEEKSFTIDDSMFVLDIEGERVLCLFAETACRVTIPMSDNHSRIIIYADVKKTS